jgi:3-phosphoglycerate kinase
MNFKRMTDLDVAGKRVFIRADLNVPSKWQSDIRRPHHAPRCPPSNCRDEGGAKVMVTSHLGRPTEGEFKRKIRSIRGRGDVRQAGQAGARDPRLGQWRL